MAPSKDQFIEVDGAVLRVRGAGAGPAILLVHGWALDLDMWRDQFDLLATLYRVIAFDRRGFGHSSGEPSIDEDVSDVDRVLERLNVERAAIVGMSQGARVAMRWALKHPDRAACLVLDAPPAEGWPQPPGAEEIPLEEYRRLLRLDGLDAFRRACIQHPFLQLHTSVPSARQLLSDIAARYQARDLLMDPPPRSSSLELRDLRRLHLPALILSGEHDTARRRAIAQRLAETLSDARLETIRNAGHLAALDNPAAYAQALHGFFSSQPAMVAGTVR